MYIITYEIFGPLYIMKSLLLLQASLHKEQHCAAKMEDLRKTDVVIIHEVPMLRAQLFDIIEFILRYD